MARYGAGVSNSGVNTANTAYFDLDNTGTTQRLLIRQIVVNIAVAPTTAPAFYLSRMTARGTPSGSLAGQPFDENDTSALGAADYCASGAQPTFSTSNIIETGGLAVTAGGTFVWSFWDVPLIVRATAGYGIVVANANASGSTTGTFKCSFVWDE